MAVLDRALLLLGESAAGQEAQVQFLCDLVCDEVMNYCRIEEIPRGLENVIVSIVLDQWGRNRGDSTVESIKEGGTQVNFSVAGYDINSGAGGADFIKNYRAQLARYARIRTV